MLCRMALHVSVTVALLISDIVHPAQNLTALPANLDDDQLEDPEAVPRPLSVYTVRIMTLVS